MLEKIKNEVQKRVLALIKEKGRFKYKGKDVPRDYITQIKALDPFCIDENGHILFSGTCEFKKELPDGNYQQFTCKFETRATLKEINCTIELDDRPISIKPQH